MQPPLILRVVFSALLALSVSPSAFCQPTLSTPAGSWTGSLSLPGASLRIVFHIKEVAAGSYTAIMDSPDQGARGIAVSRVVWNNDSLQLDVSSIGGSYTGRLNTDSLLFTGHWRQAGQRFPLNLNIAPKRPQTPKKPFPYREEEVTYTGKAAGVQLAATLTLPGGKGPFPAVLLITGSGPQNRNGELMGHEPFLVLADYLTRRGIAVLRADDRGVGRSTGDFGRATTRDFAGDALAGVNFLKARPEINPKQIGLIGQSEGGLIAPMVGAESRDVAFLVLMAGPGLPGDQLLRQQARDIMKAGGSSEGAIRQTLDLQAKMFSVLKQEQDPGQAEQKMQAVVKEAARQMTAEEKSQSGFNEAAAMGQIRQFTSPWFRYFISHDPVPVLKKIKVPVLAVNGEKDLQVDAGENLAAIRKALQEGGNKKVKVKALPGLNHLFQTATTGSPGEYARIGETFSPAAMQVVGDWITGLTKGR